MLRWFSIIWGAPWQRSIQSSQDRERITWQLSIDRSIEQRSGFSHSQSLLRSKHDTFEDRETKRQAIGVFVPAKTTTLIVHKQNYHLATSSPHTKIDDTFFFFTNFLCACFDGISGLLFFLLFAWKSLRLFVLTLRHYLSNVSTTISNDKRRHYDAEETRKKSPRVNIRNYCVIVLWGASKPIHSWTA